jgi:hypothetical protein
MSHPLSASILFERPSRFKIIHVKTPMGHAGRYSARHGTICIAAKSEHRRQVLVHFASVCLLNATVPLTAFAADPASDAKRKNLSMDQLLDIIKVEIDFH